MATSPQCAESTKNPKVGYWNETSQKINYLVSFQSPVREGKEKKYAVKQYPKTDIVPLQMQARNDQ